jgi:polar amino acid transport system permease protein
MTYTLQYGQITGYVPYLVGGAWISLQIAFLAFCGGMVIGLFGAMARTFGSSTIARLVRWYVVFITNTPQLVQIYLIFFALPDLGIVFSPYQAVLIGMTINAGAYLTEIQRAGFLSVHRSELEAAETLGMSRMQSVRYVILPHIIRVLFPPLSNQYIMMTLGTSMAAIFGVEELTGRAFNVNATTFRSIEIFSLTALIYVAITFLATVALALAGRFLVRARMRVL